jgi:hypothetical protein
MVLANCLTRSVGHEVQFIFSSYAISTQYQLNIQLENSISVYQTHCDIIYGGRDKITRNCTRTILLVDV